MIPAESEEERVRVGGRLGGEEDCGGQVVVKHRGCCADAGGGQSSGSVEKVGRLVPESGALRRRVRVA